MNIKIECLIVVGLLMTTIGCIESIKYPQTFQVQKDYINLSYDEINNIMNNCSTKIKCDNIFENQINNKYITWKSQVVEVDDNYVYVSILICNKEFSERFSPEDIRLNNVNKDFKLKLNKTDIIIYTGKLYLNKEVYNGKYLMYSDYKKAWEDSKTSGIFGWLEVYDTEILNIKSSNNLKISKICEYQPLTEVDKCLLDANCKVIP